MDWQPVSSSNLDAVAYDASTRQLFIRFNNGGTYRYDGVPPSVHAALMSAPSKGEYHAANIKHSYRYSKV